MPYLGLVNYYGKFSPNLSTVLMPLHKLLLKGVPFKWSQECAEAMKLVSGSLIDRILGHYDSEKVLRLATDASPVGVGDVLSLVIDGEEVPIAFGSRTLSSSEMKYPQLIERSSFYYLWCEKVSQVSERNKISTADRSLTISNNIRSANCCTYISYF